MRTYGVSVPDYRQWRARRRTFRFATSNFVHSILILLVLLSGSLLSPSVVLAQETTELSKARAERDAFIKQGDLEYALVAALTVLRLLEGNEHSELTEVSDAVGWVAALQLALGDEKGAMSSFEQALEINVSIPGADPAAIGSWISDVGVQFYSNGHIKEAIHFFVTSLEYREAWLGQSHPDIADSLNNLGVLASEQGDFAKAEELHERALRIRETHFLRNDLRIAQSKNNYAVALWRTGDYGHALAELKDALAIRRTNLPANHPEIAQTLNNLAEIYVDKGHFDDAIANFALVLEIRERTLGPDHPATIATINGIGRSAGAKGDLTQAEAYYREGLVRAERTMGDQNQLSATLLNNLALILFQQARFEESEALHRRALRARELMYGPNHYEVAMSVMNLGLLIEHQGKLDQAAPLYERALAIYRQTLGPVHPETAAGLSNLAGLRFKQQQYDDAAAHYLEALTIYEDNFGYDHPITLTIMENVATVHRELGHAADYEEVYLKILAIRRETLGDNNHHTARTHNNLGWHYFKEGRFAEAETHYLRSAEISQINFGPDHPEVANALHNLAGLYQQAGDYGRALETIRLVVKIHRNRAYGTADNLSDAKLTEQLSRKNAFILHNIISIAVASNRTDKDYLALISEAFESGQLARAAGTGAVINRMATRFAAGDDELAMLIRRRQDLQRRWQEADKTSIAMAGLATPTNELPAAEDARLARDAAERALSELDQQLATQFPRFQELSDPQPLTLLEARDLLSDDEVLVTMNVGKTGTIIHAIGKDLTHAYVNDVDEKVLAGIVKSLRRDLDPTFTILRDRPLRRFNFEKAHRLYEIIFGPFEPALKGIQKIIFVPDGPLQSLPLGVLVRRFPHSSDQSNGATAWLARDFAISVLPSVSALSALRTHATESRAELPFLGIGDPQLTGSVTDHRGVGVSSLFNARGGVDVEAVRNLPPLPETSRELALLAAALGTDDRALYLGKAATETQLKSLSLEDRKILAFATHGVVAGDFESLSEPAIVLTPPEVATPIDDGLLTASEVAQLRLDADWVILSACNTASSDGAPGSKGLSGLAKAFFYAGSRALFVSHWPVASDATVMLTSRMLAEAAKTGVGKAEAHRRSIVAMIKNSDDPKFAHPMFWAPFVVVGEGN